MGKYIVSTTYNNSTIVVGVDIDNDDDEVVESVALETMSYEWGMGVYKYSDITVERGN